MIEDKLIELAIEEDIGYGDITTLSTIPYDLNGEARIIAKEKLVVAGINIAIKVFNTIDNSVKCNPLINDGELANPQDVLLELYGKVHSLLKGERIALNFLQRLSGIATLTKEFVNKIEEVSINLHKRPVIVDTRKTLPGWRVLDKYAVRVGGGKNHRFGLFDGILIKNNHIKACGGVKNAVLKAKQNAPHTLKIEVEVTNFDELNEALEAKADIIMFDNMSPLEIKKGVQIVNNRALIEVSGGIKLENISSIVDLGVDLISVGALTHSAKAKDISMNIYQVS